MIYADYPFPQANQDQALALGFFDGVHKGHQFLLSELGQRAKREGLRQGVFTFAARPRRRTSNIAFPGLLQKQSERLAMLEDYVDQVYVAPVNKSVLDLSPAEFIDRILVKTLRAKVVICGADFRFGRNAGGSISDLARAATDYGFQFEPVPDYQLDGEIVSSTRIRQLVKLGQMEQAANLLGRPFAYQGFVTSGQKLGRRLGFPTINISLSEDQICAALGVYISRVKIGQATYPGISNLGYHPTVGRGAWPRLETYLYDFEGDLYGEELTVELLAYLRPEQKFASVDLMRAEVMRNLDQARSWHKVNTKLL